MDLFERYLHAVGTFLPNAQREDVIRELSEDLRTQVEERQAELGRPLNENEQEQILKQWGHPLVFALRYQPRQQLIGPLFFPIYWFVLKVALLGGVVINVVAGALLLAHGTPIREVASRIVSLPFGPLLMVFAWVTVVFAILDRQVPRLGFVTQWNPRSLPAVPAAPTAPSRWTLLSEIALSIAFVLWLAAIPRHDWLVFGPASNLFDLGAPVLAIHLPLVVVSCAGILVQWVNVIHPEWLTLRLSGRIGCNVLSLALLWFAAGRGGLVVAQAAGGHVEALARTVDLSVRISLIAVAIGTAIAAVIDVARLVRRSHVPHGWSSRVGC